MTITKPINLLGIDYESVVDGIGVRTVLFFAGCSHDCQGCHNPESHDFKAGKVFDEDIANEILSYIEEAPYIKGITLSGGDCFFNPIPIIYFVEAFKERFPDKDIWAYTGFNLEEILLNDNRRKLFELCDVLVDGRFIQEEKGFNLKFKGSNNQRIIDVKQTINAGKVVLYK